MNNLWIRREKYLALNTHHKRIERKLAKEKKDKEEREKRGEAVVAASSKKRKDLSHRRNHKIMVSGIIYLKKKVPFKWV